MPGFRRLRLRRSPSPDRSRPATGERGFVLIAAIWLLILAGSIAAILMLRSLAGATAAADHGEASERRLALESAIETMLADRLFNGHRSAWWLAPVQGRITIGDHEVDVRMTSESGRLDVNAANPALIDTMLRGSGVSASERERILARLQALRAMKKNIGSLAELESLLATAGGTTCLADQLTWVSGLAEPRPDQVSPELARALGSRGGATGDGGQRELEGGAAMRIEAAEPGGQPIVAIVRLTGLIDRPVQASVWGAPSSCAGRGRGA